MPDITDPLPMPEPKLKPKQTPPLPYPDKVPCPTVKGNEPSLAERTWCNRWNLIRHFLLAGCAAAVTAWTTTKDWTATGGAFVIGGIAGSIRKGGDDELRAAGKPDMITAAANMLKHKTNGKEVGMIREEVSQLGVAISKLVTRLIDDKPNKEELQGILTDAFGLVTEGTDFAALPKEDRLKAGIHALTIASAMVAGSEIKYSDETVPA